MFLSFSLQLQYLCCLQRFWKGKQKKKEEEQELEEEQEEEEDDGREVNDEFIHHFKVSRG